MWLIAIPLTAHISNIYIIVEGSVEQPFLKKGYCFYVREEV